MDSESTVLHKSFVFAKRIVKLYKHLLADGQPWALADQLLRSGTAIEANVEEVEVFRAVILPLSAVSLTKKPVKPTTGFAYSTRPTAWITV